MCHNVIANPSHALIGVCANCVMRSSQRPGVRAFPSPNYRFSRNGPKLSEAPYLD